MRTNILPALLLFLAVLAAGCKSPRKQDTRENGEPLILADKDPEPVRAISDSSRTIALVMKTLTNPFFVALEKGARRAEKELGIRLLVETHGDETAIEQQISIVKKLIRDRVDAIVIIPGNSTEMIPVIKEALDAGILVINIDNRMDMDAARKWGVDHIPFVGVNNEQGAYLVSRYLVEKLNKPAEVAIIEGDPAAQSSKDRKAGALRGFAESSDIQVVEVATAYWKIDEAYEVTARLLAEHPDIKAIFCANDIMALGVIRYLGESRRDDVLVGGYDAVEEARAAVRQGKLAATVDQQAGEQGYLGVQYAVRALQGKTLPPETFIDVKLVTAHTLSEP